MFALMPKVTPLPKVEMPPAIDRYKKMCAVAEVTEPPEIKLVELMAPVLNVLANLNLGFYETAKVQRYLNSRAHDRTVVWRRLPSTAGAPAGFGAVSEYTKAVPTDALAIVAQLKKSLPGELVFFVNDYEAKAPDPFLAIACVKDPSRGSVGRPEDLRTFRVIYHWDEPGFGL